MERLPSKTNRTFKLYSDKVPEPVLRALAIMGQKLTPCVSNWLVGGSCGALLQGVPLRAVPRDLDVYADTDDAITVHKLLSDFSIDEQQYNETSMYGSVLSHYSIEGVHVELVGSFKVRLEQAEYAVRIQSLLSSYAEIGLVDDTPIHFMPLAHELVFNVLRERPDRFEAIAETMRSAPDKHIPLLHMMLASNSIGRSYVERLWRLLHLSPNPEEGQR